MNILHSQDAVVMESNHEVKKRNPRANTTSRKYKQQIEWRINKTRELLAKGYSQFEISRDLHVSQSTISKDLELIRKKYRLDMGEDGTPSLQEYADLSLAVDELIHSLWKIIDDARASPKLRLKAHSMMMEYYQFKAQLLTEISKLDENKHQVDESVPEELKFEQKDEIKTQKWTKRSLEKRLKYHTQIGFAADHFEMMDQIKNVQQILFRALQDESSKDEKNLIGMCKIYSSILQTIQTLRVLILDTPYIASMKREIDKAREIERVYGKKTQVRKPFDPKDYPPSALVIDPNSIAGRPVDIVDDNDDPVVE